MMNFFRLFKLAHMRETAMRSWSLLRHPGVPMPLKLLTVGLALFILSPLNILGDIPLLGIVDDFALLSLLLNWFVKEATRRQATATIEGGSVLPYR